MTDEGNQPDEKGRGTRRSPRKRTSRSGDTASAPTTAPPPPAPGTPSGGGTSPLVMAALALGTLGLIMGAVGWNKADSAKKLASERDTGQIETVSAAVQAVQASQAAMQEKLAAIENQDSPMGEQYDALAARFTGLEQQYSALAAQDGSLRDELGASLSRLQEAIETAQQGLDAQIQAYQSSLSDQYSADEQARTEQMQGFRSAFGELSQSVSSVSTDLGQRIRTWSLKEVEQLLMLANQRVQLAQDPVTAQAALQLADERLAEIEDPALTEVRRAIAAESASLDSIERVDVPGIALRLGALTEEVEALPLPKAEPSVAAPESADGKGEEDSQDNAWVQAGRRLLDDVSGMISVRNIEHTRTPIVPVEQEYFLRENLRLMLNSAQFALLRGDQEVYAQLLGGAGQWVAGNFDTSQESVGRFADALAELGNIAIRPELPDIAESLAELRKVIQARGAS